MFWLATGQVSQSLTFVTFVDAMEQAVA